MCACVFVCVYVWRAHTWIFDSLFSWLGLKITAQQQHKSKVPMKELQEISTKIPMQELQEIFLKKNFFDEDDGGRKQVPLHPRLSLSFWSAWCFSARISLSAQTHPSCINWRHPTTGSLAHAGATILRDHRQQLQSLDLHSQGNKSSCQRQVFSSSLQWVHTVCLVARFLPWW